MKELEACIIVWIKCQERCYGPIMEKNSTKLVYVLNSEMVMPRTCPNMTETVALNLKR